MIAQAIIGAISGVSQSFTDFAQNGRNAQSKLYAQGVENMQNTGAQIGQGNVAQDELAEQQQEQARQNWAEQMKKRFANKRPMKLADAFNMQKKTFNGGNNLNQTPKADNQGIAGQKNTGIV